MRNPLLIIMQMALAGVALGSPTNVHLMTVSGVQPTVVQSNVMSPGFSEVGVGTVTLSDDGSGNLVTSGSIHSTSPVTVASGGTNSSTALNNNRFIISSGGEIVEQSALAATSAVATDANGLPVASATTATQLGYLSTTTSNVQSQLNSLLPLSGGSMTGNILMTTGATVTGIPTPVGSTDAASKGYVDGVASGLTWLSPIQDPDLISDNLSTPPVSPIVSVIYLIGPAPTGVWTSIGAGHAVWWTGSAYTDLLGRAVIVGDRFGVTLEHGSGSESGDLVGKHNNIAQVTNATPGSYAFTFTAPLNSQAIFVGQPNSDHFGHSYTYLSASTAWVEFSGPSATPLGNPLYYSGNTINLGYDLGTVDLNGSNQLEVAASAITDAKVSATAAIAFTKLASMTSASLLLGNGSNVPTITAMSGDVTISSTGSTTVGSVGTSSAANIHSAEVAANAATAADTNSTIVKRDGSGNIAVSQLTATSAVFNGATSGTTTLQPTAVATGTLTLPATTDTLTANAATQTLTNKTISGTSNTLQNLATEDDFTGDGTTVTFTLAEKLTAARFVQVSVDGRLQREGGSYSWTRVNATPGQITFNVAPESGSWIDVTVVNQ